MHITEIEARLFQLADQSRETSPDLSRAIIGTIAHLREWHQAHETERTRKLQDLFQKWSAFSNGYAEETYAQQSAAIEQERDRVLRALAVDPRWQGSYADLVNLVQK